MIATHMNGADASSPIDHIGTDAQTSWRARSRQPATGRTCAGILCEPASVTLQTVRHEWAFLTTCCLLSHVMTGSCATSFRYKHHSALPYADPAYAWSWELPLGVYALSVTAVTIILLCH